MVQPLCQIIKICLSEGRQLWKLVNELEMLSDPKRNKGAMVELEHGVVADDLV